MDDRTKYDARVTEVYNDFRRYLPRDHKAWHTREYDLSKVRLPPEWGLESFWFYGYNVWRHHFVHVSEKDPALLAFTADNDKGERDIQTQIKPGRYLKEFFGDQLTDKQVANYARWHATGTRPKSVWNDYALKFAATPDEIAHVYRHGPSSCMDGTHFRYASTHPTRAYGAGDLQVAYLEGKPPPHRRNKALTVVARALVWPEKKVVSRIYPTPDAWETDGFEGRQSSFECQNALGSRLQALGYRAAINGNELDGAKLLRIKKKKSQRWPLRDGVILPFLDGGYNVFDKTTHLALSGKGDFCSNAQGWAELRHPYDCWKCGAGVPSSQTRSVLVPQAYSQLLAVIFCLDCTAQSTFTCAGSGERCHNDVPHEIQNGQSYQVTFLKAQAEQKKRADLRKKEMDQLFSHVRIEVDSELNRIVYTRLSGERT